MPTPSEQPPRRLRTIILGWGFVLGAFLIGGALLWPGIQSARNVRDETGCVATLKYIGLAMQSYHSQYGCFPPAYLADNDGQPMHSWRLQPLPHLGAEQLYEEYSFDEPWNSPNNLALAHNVPVGMLEFHSTYRCPSDSEASEQDATYLMPVGPGAFSDGPNGRKIGEITDGTSNTIVAAERSQSGIHWMEPRDLNVEDMSFKINDPAGYGIRSTHPGVVNMVFGDGHTDSISKDIDPRVLRALITVAGGEDVLDY